MIFMMETVVTETQVANANFDLIAMEKQKLTSNLLARAKVEGHEWDSEPTTEVVDETITSERTGNKFLVHHVYARLVTNDDNDAEVIA